MLPFELKPVTVVCGHYGVGKTNFALNLAVDAAEAGFEVFLVDLDIVNPYFRSSEYRILLEDAGVNLIAPVFAESGTSLDVPSLTGAIAPAINRAYFDERKGEGRIKVIVDVGGDDAGATSLARFARDVKRGEFDLLYVVNALRNLTQSAEESLEVLREIEARSGLAATGIVGNTHLKSETTLDVIARGVGFAVEVASHVPCKVACITAPISLVRRVDVSENPDLTGANLYPVRILVKSPWE